MSTRERILTIRLLEKASRQSAFAAVLGIDCITDVSVREEKEEPP